MRKPHMRYQFGSVGPRGLTLLAVAGVAGVLLAAHGWAHHSNSGALGSLAGGQTAAQQPGRGASAPIAYGPSAEPSSSAARAQPPSHSGVAASTPGPLLKSQPFAPYAFAIWPGRPSSAAKAALTGLSVSVRRETSGLSVAAAVNGQSTGSAHFYSKGAHVYVVEATMGDDSGSSDYNLGDDGLVVTDTQGRIVS
jgi:hypothetical protein